MRLIAGLAIIWAGLFLFPTSIWFETHDLRISDATEGQSPQVAEDRTIRNPFPGLYTVEVREVTSGDLFCHGWSFVPYRESSRRIRRMALTSYADGDVDCRKLPPGQYLARVERRIGWFLFLRKAVAESNVFTVRPREVIE